MVSAAWALFTPSQRARGRLEGVPDQPGDLERVGDQHLMGVTVADLRAAPGEGSRAEAFAQAAGEVVPRGSLLGVAAVEERAQEAESSSAGGT